jgi:hypothetical protein
MAEASLSNAGESADGEEENRQRPGCGEQYLGGIGGGPHLRDKVDCHEHRIDPEHQSNQQQDLASQFRGDSRLA